MILKITSIKVLILNIIQHVWKNVQQKQITNDSYPVTSDSDTEKYIEHLSRSDTYFRTYQFNHSFELIFIESSSSFNALYSSIPYRVPK